MTQILLGPTLTGGATTKVRDKATGKFYYRKQILPEGKYKYKTSKGEDVDLDLSAGQLNTFVDAFKSKAYDEVPFQIGHGDDKDLTARKGTLAEVQYVKGKGVDGFFELEADAAAYVEKYPQFGVSPRIVLDIKRMDGKNFAGAIQHVAGTAVPRATGMSPWSKIELSEEGDTSSETDVIDLSMETVQAHVDRKEIVVTTPNTKKEGEGDPKKVFTLSEDEYKFLQDQKKDYEEIMGSTKQTETQTSTVDLSEVTSKADQALAGLAAMRAEAVKSQWDAQKALLLSQGVPPAALDLATPVMESVDSQVFDLSDGEGGTVKVDSKTQMLGQLQLMKGMVDLGSEVGHGMGIEGNQPQGDSLEDMDAWMKHYGV